MTRCKHCNHIINQHELFSGRCESPILIDQDGDIYRWTSCRCEKFEPE